MGIFVWILVFVASLSLLIKASDFFTSAAEKLGLMFGMTPFAVGVVIVSIGTSLPELISSFVAVASGSPEIVAGNVIGSNIANIFFILGIGAIMGRELIIRHNLIRVDLPLLLASALFLAMTVMDGYFSRAEALLFIAALVVFFAYMLSDSSPAEISDDPGAAKMPFSPRPVFILLGSAALIFVGAKYTVDAVIALSDLLSIGKEVVAVSAVALGTSLPELMVTISAVRKKNNEMVVGNVLGSNIFNTFGVMGLPGLIHGLVVPENMVTIGITTMVIATILFFGVTQDKQVTRWEGWIFLILYVYFIGRIFNLM